MGSVWGRFRVGFCGIDSAQATAGTKVAQSTQRRTFLFAAGMVLGLVWSAAIVRAAAVPTTQPLKPVPFTDVHFRDEFWAPRIETNRTVTIPHDFAMCEKTGRIA